MSEVLTRWNALPFEDAAEEILPCCGSHGWARSMAAQRPIHDQAALLVACDEVCKNLNKADWLEALCSHPRIGESSGPPRTSERSAAWSSTEQQNVRAADEEDKLALKEGNRAYEKRFQRIFVVCATGKSAPEILQILRRRLPLDDDAELLEAAEEQRQITHIRLRKWLST